MDDIRVVIAEGMPEMRKHMRALLTLNPGLKVIGECSDGEVAIRMVSELKPDIALVDMNLTGLDGIKTIELLTLSAPGTLVIATSNRGGKENIKKAMLAGARDFILKPFTENILVDTVVNLHLGYVENIRRLQNKDFKSGIQKPKVITIFSTKGGVGKTTLATNIALYIAQKTGDKTALLDFDFQFGDIPIMLNLHPTRTIMELINENQDIDTQLLDDYLINHLSGTRILPAPLGPEYADYINTQNTGTILKVLQETYKYIVIDTAPVFNDINLSVMDMSDRILFITTPELSTIKNVKAGLQLMRELKYYNKVSLILNRYSHQYGIDNIELGKVLGKKILYVIPEDNAAVINSINKGKPLVLANKNNHAAKRIKDIANTLIEDYKDQKQSIWRILRG